MDTEEDPSGFHTQAAVVRRIVSLLVLDLSFMGWKTFLLLHLLCCLSCGEKTAAAVIEQQIKLKLVS